MLAEPCHLQVRVGLFRLKALAGDTYDALTAPETSTLQQLQVNSGDDFEETSIGEMHDSVQA